jgi:UDP-N-acetylglucosamine acyltransferase
MAIIHPTAIVDPSVTLAEDVEIGPHVFIDADVTIGSGTRLMHGAHIGRWTVLGKENQVFPHAVIGQAPQDIGYHDEEAWTVVGDNNIFREGVTVHRGNRQDTSTIIGNHNFFMVNSHIAHNCRIGDHVLLVNGALLGGHVEIRNRAIISGNCVVHQFVRIGELAMMRGGSSATKDVPPFCINDEMSWIRSVNLIGMRRNGFDTHRILAVKRAFKTIFRSGRRLEDSINDLEAHLELTADVRMLIDFIRGTKRGIGSGRSRLAEQ